MNVWIGPPATTGTETKGILLDGFGNVLLCDNCPCDTGTGSDCCLPNCDTLVATISNTSGCEEIDGDEVTLTGGPLIYSGSHLTLGRMQLECDPSYCTGPGAQKWKLWMMDCPSLADDQKYYCAKSSSSCDPFSLDFGPVTVR